MTWYKFTRPDGTTQHGFRYPLPHNGEPGEWIETPNPATDPDGLACGSGRLHFMKVPFPTYAPWPYIAYEAEPGGILVGEDEEKAGWTKGRLLLQINDIELDKRIDLEFERRFGIEELYLPIAWARLYQPFREPLDTAWIQQKLTPVATLLRKPDIVRVIKVGGASLEVSLEESLWASLGASLWDSLGVSLGHSLEASLGASLGVSLGHSLEASLGASLWASLRVSLGHSLWASLFYDRGFVLAGEPKPELASLLDVWKAGACPVGWGKNHFLVLAKL